MNSRDYTFVNPNHFQADLREFRNAQRRNISLRCPHCRHVGSFQVAREHCISYTKFVDGNRTTEVFASIRRCPNESCSGLVMVVEDDYGTLEIEPPELLDFDPKGLPERCQRTLAEAVACHASGAYRAAAMMVRRLLEEICDENGIFKGNLHSRLQELRTKVVLPEAFFTAMGELKALGNDAAHVEAKTYDLIGQEEAEDSIELAKEIVKALYQLQGLIERLQSRKKQ